MPKKRRRTKGSGCIFKRGEIFWIQYRKNGRRLCESAQTSDRGQAEEFLQRKIGEVAAAGEIPMAKATVSDLLRLVVADYQLRSLRSLDKLRWKIGAHIERLLGKVPAARFGSSQVRAYVQVRQEENANNATINRELSIVHRAFVLGAREEPPLVRRAPHIPKLEESDPRQGFIEQAQYDLLLATLPDRFKAIFVLGYHFGCRFGELRKLRWDQIDFEAGEITLENSQVKNKNGRMLPFYGEVREWLERQREMCTGKLVFCYRKCQNKVTREGKPAVELPFGRNLEKNGWHEACEAAGLKNLLFHDLRRSAVRNMMRSGISEVVARAISGHRTSSVFNRYNITVNSDLKDAAKRMNEFLSAQKQNAAKLRLVKR